MVHIGVWNVTVGDWRKGWKHPWYLGLYTKKGGCGALEGFQASCVYTVGFWSQNVVGWKRRSKEHKEKKEA